jgi:8-oxo-dGTP pyrophosphatase MutT (NUDIX family)
MSELTPKHVEVHEIKPEDFKAIAQVAACYLEVDGHLLLLECSALKPEAGKWGVPAGKIEANELPEDAARRELFEETGIQLQHSCLQSLGALYIRKPEVDYVYHLFKITLHSRPEVQLSNEHLTYLWAKAEDLESLPLMDGAKKVLDKYRAFIAQKRVTASVNVYLILRKNDQVLLLLRKNSGYLDGHWGFPAGHVELGESATNGMIREAKEELGITLSAEDLKVVHIIHRKTSRANIDIFFECDRWQGEIVNQEEQKCGGLEFFSLASLPSPIVDYNANALKDLEQKQFYSERGFL